MKQTAKDGNGPLSSALETAAEPSASGSPAAEQSVSGSHSMAVTVTEKAERSLRAGHPWVYADEVTSVSPGTADGLLTSVFSKKGRFLGTGFYNSHSKIRVRILSTNANDVPENGAFSRAFYERRIRYAIDYRKTVMGEDFCACRLIFGEADQFPGLTVDLFEDVLSVQCLSLGMDRILDLLLDLLVSALAEDGVAIRAVYLRNDVPLRELEGLSQGKGYWQPERFGQAEKLGQPFGDTAEITENGLRYRVDYVNGQKTGFFLDQKYNRRAAAKLAKGKAVLDCFTHTGAFALNCAKAGARSVEAVDISESALASAKINAALNGLSDRVTFRQGDVFSLLAALAESKRHPYDYLILDPPAFTKSQTTVHNAYNGYKEINLRAMRILPRGGYLATCSCSHFMGDELFRKMLADAAHDAKVSLRQIEARTQSPDHPILWNVRETDYLKFYLFQIV